MVDGMMARAALRPGLWIVAARGLCAGLFVVAVAVTFPGSAKSGVRRPALSDELACLARTLYFEARGEPTSGQRAVGHVVMNRVADPRFPNTVCGVVKQGGTARYQCQFTWWCDGLSDKPADAVAWRRSQTLARQIYFGLLPDPTHGALWYHATSVQPAWRSQLALTRQIGAHVFYGDRAANASRTQLASLPR